MGATIHTQGDRRRFLMSSTLVCLLCIGFLPECSLAGIGTLSEQEIYGVDSAASLRGRATRNWDSIGNVEPFYVPEGKGSEAPRIQTEVELPEGIATGRGDPEFREYWKMAEKQNGIGDLRGRLGSWDIDKTWVPHLYFFDSSLVIFPGWFILRKK